MSSPFQFTHSHPAPGNHFCLYRLVYSGHFIRMESSTVFWDWLLPLSVMFSGFIPAVTQVWTTLHRVEIPGLFMRSSGDRSLACLHLGITTCSVTTNIWTQVSVWTVFISLGLHTRFSWGKNAKDHKTSQPLKHRGSKGSNHRNLPRHTKETNFLIFQSCSHTK